MEPDTKKEAFFRDWKDVKPEDATGFQNGWHKGYDAGHAAASHWVPIVSAADLPEDGVYLWTCNFGGVRDVRKVQLLTMKDGSRRVGPGVDLGLDLILAYQRLPKPFRGE